MTSHAVLVQNTQNRRFSLAYGAHIISSYAIQLTRQNKKIWFLFLPSARRKICHYLLVHRAAPPPLKKCCGCPCLPVLYRCPHTTTDTKRSTMVEVFKVEVYANENVLLWSGKRNTLPCRGSAQRFSSFWGREPSWQSPHDEHGMYMV